MVSGIVVAGGQSRRIGFDKRRLRLWGAQGPTLLERTLDTLAPLCDELVVVLNDPQQWPHLQARLVSDIYADGGVLGAVYVGLLAAQHPHSLVVAADMPLLNAHLLAAMLAYPRTYDLLIPRSIGSDTAPTRGYVEPLHAIYSRACLIPMRQLLYAGTRRMTDLLERVRVTYLAHQDQECYDPHGLSFANINTPADLERVRQVLDNQP